MKCMNVRLWWLYCIGGRIMMKPFSDSGRLSQQQRNFNYQHSRARMVIENSFGRCKVRWRILNWRFDMSTEDIHKVHKERFNARRGSKRNGRKKLLKLLPQTLLEKHIVHAETEDMVAKIWAEFANVYATISSNFDGVSEDALFTEVKNWVLLFLSSNAFTDWVAIRI